ncbi:MAG: translation initiation factor IF-2 [bacterium]|nr:translation initiation factor IF-2 [bacterium]
MGNSTPNGKIRVYELARDLGLDDSKPLIRILLGMGYPVKTASSSITDEAVQKVRDTVKPHLEQMQREAKGKKAKVVGKEVKTEKTSPAVKRVRVVKRAATEEKNGTAENKAEAQVPEITATVIEQPKTETDSAVTAQQIDQEESVSAVAEQPQDTVAQTEPSVSADVIESEAQPSVAAPEPQPEENQESVSETEELPAAAPQEQSETEAELAATASPKAFTPLPAAESKPEIKGISPEEAFRINKPAAERSTKVEVRISEKSPKNQPKKRMPRYYSNDNASLDDDDKLPEKLSEITADVFGMEDEELDKPVSLSPFTPEQAFSLPKPISKKDKNLTENALKTKAVNRSATAQRPGSGLASGRSSQTMGRPGQNRQGQSGHASGSGRPGQNSRMGQNFARGGQNFSRPGQNRPVIHGKKKGPEQHIEDSKVISLPEVIALAELAKRLSKPANEIIRYLISQGKMVTINQPLQYEEACKIATDFGFEVGDMTTEDIPLELIETEEERDLTPRPPVVTVLGHVDHGKTSLLDAIRSTSVTEGEAGGITQKIGAYTVTHTATDTDEKRQITFIDTPGHEAFTQMRARGASVTDIAVLVVAANDGVMPQTIEAINHAKAAKVPIIVAINKCDLPDAAPDRVMQQLTEYGLIAEDWGGDTVMVQVSAKKRINLSELLDMILLVADMNELKANASMHAQGTILEGWMSKGMGPVATVLIQTGTLHVGDTVVVGKTWGRVRSLTNEKGKRIPSAGPSIPAEITGLNDVPNAGDYLQAVEDERMAKQVSAARVAQERNKRITSGTKQTLESLFSDLENGVAKDLNILVKADGHGSMEAINQSLNKLSTDEVAIKIVHSGVGAITESDVNLASASNAMIVGFNVRPDNQVKRVALQEGVDIRYYQVIYHVMDDIRSVMSGLLSPDIEEQEIGHVEVRQVFKISKAGKVAGCYVTDGKVVRDGLVRVLRDGVVIFTGRIDTLKRFKDDAKEVSEGYECGLTVADYPNVEVGDILEIFQKVEHKREL